MTSRTDFTEEEWSRLGRAPLVAGAAVSLADPGGPIEAVKESAAAVQTLVAGARDGSFGEFVRAVAQDTAEKLQRRENPIAHLKADRSRALEPLLDDLRAVSAILVEKTDPQDAAAYRDWIRTAAQRVALAAREGGFLGIGGERVSEREQQMLDTLGEIFGAPRGAPPADRPA